jgi:tetratricopeptide (TPR) repeat protein
VALNGDEEKALTARPTTNPQAYDAYLRGHAFDDQNEGFLQPDAIRNAIDAYSEATRLDPKFALAFAKLGADQLRWAILDVTDSARVRVARQSIDSSLALAPDLPEGHQAHAHFLAFFMDDRDGSYNELVRANALKPNDAALLSELGHQQVVRGLTEQGFASIAKAVRLDPRSLDAIERAARENYNARRYAEAERYANQYIALAPTSPVGYNWKINCEIDGRGDTAAARQTLETAVSRGTRWSVSLASQYTNLGPAGWAKLEQLSLADMGASQFIDSSYYYAVKLDMAVAEGRQGSVRAYGDSLLKIGLSPRFTGPLVSWRYTVLGAAYAGLGRRAEAFQQLALAEEAAARLSADDSHRGNMEEQIAQVFGTLGEADSSIAHIKMLLKLPSGFSKETARTDLSFAPLRGKPAWEKFLSEH